jgi:hypothetical protein
MAQRSNEQADNTNHHRAADHVRESGNQHHEATQHVDRVALLKEGSTRNNAGTQGNDAAAAKSADHPKDGKLHMTDVYAQTVKGYKSEGEDGHDQHTRGLKPADGKSHKHDSHDKHHEKDQKPADGKAGDKAGDKPGDKSEKDKVAKPAETAVLLNNDKNFDNNKPTVAYLDDFSKAANNREKINEQNGLSHGEFSARGAEQNGFNAYRLQSKTTSPDGGKHQDYSKPLNEIADKIENGQLKMGRGGVVNVSMGHHDNDKTFEEANTFLGTKGLNAENLKDRRPEVLDKLNQVANDQKRSDDDRAWAKTALDTNKAIDRLQEKGIHVMHAAGNDNTATEKRFSMDFMNASEQLGSNKPNGKPDSFSADHSLLSERGKTDGVYTFKYSGMDAMSKTPVADQKGFYQADNANLRFEGSEFGGRLGSGNQTWNIDRAKFVDNGQEPNQASPDKLDKSAFSQPKTAPDQKFSNDAVTKWNPNGFGDATKSSYGGDASKAQSIKVQNRTSDAQAAVTDKPEGADSNDRASWVAGTSFANIRRLTEMHDQLMMEKSQSPN